MTTAVSEAADLADPITLDESVTMAFLTVLDSMAPAQRVAVILHGVFGYSFGEIAALTGRPQTECRQLGRVRAAQLAAVPGARQPASAGVVRDFKRAWEAGDADAVVSLLDPSATAMTDTGGLAGAALCPVEGDERVAHYLLDLAATLALEERTVNGRPGLVALRDGVPATVFALDVEGGRITRVCAFTRPRELAAAGTP